MVHPDVIVYAAGDNSLEWAEQNPREAERIHTSGAATVSNVSEILQPKYIYLSNSYVFDGQRGNYHETDIVLPSTAMGKAKVGGENFIRAKCLHYTILRTSPVFGRGNGKRLSFLDHLRMRLDHGERVELPNDELHSFAPVYGLADIVERLVDSGPRNKVIHYGGLTRLTYYDFGREFAKRFGYDPALISPQRQEQPHAKGAPTGPAYDFSLNSTYVAQTLKVQPLLLEESFNLIEKQLIPRF
jgi:dTDP-4-dehydrorhamnose reductase